MESPAQGDPPAGAVADRLEPDPVSPNLMEIGWFGPYKGAVMSSSSGMW